MRLNVACAGRYALPIATRSQHDQRGAERAKLMPCAFWS
jgi:hypothetical protein